MTTLRDFRQSIMPNYRPAARDNYHARRLAPPGPRHYRIAHALAHAIPGRIDSQWELEIHSGRVRVAMWRSPDGLRVRGASLAANCLNIPAADYRSTMHSLRVLAALVGPGSFPYVLRRRNWARTVHIVSDGMINPANSTFLLAARDSQITTRHPRILVPEVTAHPALWREISPPGNRFRESIRALEHSLTLAAPGTGMVAIAGRIPAPAGALARLPVCPPLHYELFGGEEAGVADANIDDPDPEPSDNDTVCPSCDYEYSSDEYPDECPSCGYQGTMPVHRRR